MSIHACLLRGKSYFWVNENSAFVTTKSRPRCTKQQQQSFCETRTAFRPDFGSTSPAMLYFFFFLTASGTYMNSCVVATRRLSMDCLHNLFLRIVVGPWPSMGGSHNLSRATMKFFLRWWVAPPTFLLTKSLHLKPPPGGISWKTLPLAIPTSLVVRTSLSSKKIHVVGSFCFLSILPRVEQPWNVHQRNSLSLSRGYYRRVSQFEWLSIAVFLHNLLGLAIAIDRHASHLIILWWATSSNIFCWSIMSPTSLLSPPIYIYQSIFDIHRPQQAVCLLTVVVAGNIYIW